MAWPATQAIGQTAATATTTRFDIPAQDLRQALLEFWRQSGQELLYSDTDVAGKRSSAIDGALDRSAALTALLQGTGLEFEVTPSGGIMVGDRATLDAQRGMQPGADAAAASRYAGIEEVIVTGQKREERMQDVPIAISAFSMDALDAQKIEGGFDLLKAVPNVTFSKTNFTGYNFQIRGIGTQAVSATSDPGVAVSYNNTTLIVNRLFEQEYLDIERVEVLRGPQGTLYGRNATGGVINVITAKPVMGQFGGEVKIEGGNYDTRRVRGHYNFPLNESGTLAGRVAYASTVRDGYGFNEASEVSSPFRGNVARDIDNRDLWTGRLSIGWQPTDIFRANFIYERFEEDDRRVRSAKQLCRRDAGPEYIGGLAVADITTGNPQMQIYHAGGAFSQGCLPGSLYDDSAYGVPHGGSLSAVQGLILGSVVGTTGGVTNMGFVGPLLGMDMGCDRYDQMFFFTLLDRCTGMDPYGNAEQSRDLRSSFQPIDPVYRAKADIYEWSFDLDVSDRLTLSSQSVYVRDNLFSTQDFTRFQTSSGVFGDTLVACDNPSSPCAIAGGFYANLAPGGVFTDPQLGASDTMIIQDSSRSVSRQFNQELRLTSDFDGAWNFSLGANYTRFSTTSDYFVFSNLFTALLNTSLYRGPNSPCIEEGVGCAYIDPRPLHEVLADDNPEGHNYFLSRNPYRLNSAAAFGEVYWLATPDFKVTAGLRLTWDRKIFTPIPSQLLLSDYREPHSLGGVYVGPGQGPEACHGERCRSLGNAPGGRGFVAEPDMVQNWRVPTGRLGVDWKPRLPFTDETMVYAFYSRGFKSGGANPPSIAPPSGLFVKAATSAVSSPTFEPEYVDAFEIGAKNTLLGGTMILNIGAFYYDYKDYQVSRIVDRQALNDNFDATVWGLELESIWSPLHNTQFNAAIGYLRTRVADGEQAIDLMDRTQGGNQRFELPEGVTFSYVDRDGETVVRDAFDEWMIIKPWIQNTQNCVVPVEVVENSISSGSPNSIPIAIATYGVYCLGGGYRAELAPNWDPETMAPNAGAGFFADLGGNELPNAPRFTVSLGAQQTIDLPREWSLNGRVDWYWQDKAYHRVFNTEYDRLKSWSNTNLAVWLDNPRLGLTLEAYVKNLFDQTPITGAFLNSEEVGLSTNVFTLDPRLVGISIRKRF